MRWGMVKFSSGKSAHGDVGGEFGRPSTWGKVLQTAEVVSDVAANLLFTRGRFRPTDYIALGVKSVHASMQLYSLWSTEKHVNLAEFFEHEDSEWKSCSVFASMLAFEGMEIREQIVESHKIVKGGKVVSAAWTAVVDGVDIGWTGPPTQDHVPDQIWSKTPHKIRDIAARRLWEKAGSDKVLRIQGERTSPHYMPPAVIETEFLRSVERRARLFLDRGKPRAMMMDGEPGTGKTTAAAHMAKKLGFKTVVINAEDFIARYQDRDGFSAHGAELAEILKPDVLIVNDIDRILPDNQLQLLDIFDNAKSYARIVFVTTNHYRKLIEPVRRPGRLDDLIRVPGLTRVEIELVAPDVTPLAERMLGWPIAYVRDMQDRFDVLGTESYAEIGEVERRLREVREDGRYGEPPTETEEKEAETTAKWGIQEYMKAGYQPVRSPDGTTLLIHKSNLGRPNGRAELTDDLKL